MYTDSNVAPWGAQEEPIEPDLNMEPPVEGPPVEPPPPLKEEPLENWQVSRPSYAQWRLCPFLPLLGGASVVVGSWF